MIKNFIFEKKIFFLEFGKELKNLSEKLILDKLKNENIEDITNINKLEIIDIIEGNFLKNDFIFEIKSIRNISKGIDQQNIYDKNSTIGIEWKNKFIKEVNIYAVNATNIDLKYKNLEELINLKIIFKKNTKINKIKNRYILIFEDHNFFIMDSLFNFKKLLDKNKNN